MYYHLRQDRFPLRTRDHDVHVATSVGEGCAVNVILVGAGDGEGGGVEADLQAAQTALQDTLLAALKKIRKLYKKKN